MFESATSSLSLCGGPQDYEKLNQSKSKNLLDGAGVKKIPIFGVPYVATLHLLGATADPLIAIAIRPTKRSYGIS